MVNPSVDPDSGLPLRDSLRTHSKIIIGHHLILMGYGHWLPNDPRGSGSEEIRQEKLDDLGSIHHGRKKPQPSRDELKAFYKEAEPLLEFPRLWYDRNGDRRACQEKALHALGLRRAQKSRSP